MKFNPNSSFFRFMGTLFDFTLLNWAFMLTCIPVFTIGASLTAMHATMLAYVDNDATALSKTYFKNFRKNFKQATIAFLLLAVAFLILGFNIAFWRKFDSLFAMPILVVVIVVTAALIFITELVFPLISRFQNTLKQSFKNAALMSLPSFFRVLMLIGIDVAAFGLFYLTNIGRAMFIIFGFAFWLYLKAFVQRTIFAKFSDEI